MGELKPEMRYAHLIDKIVMKEVASESVFCELYGTCHFY